MLLAKALYYREMPTQEDRTFSLLYPVPHMVTHFAWQLFSVSGRSAGALVQTSMSLRLSAV